MVTLRAMAEACHDQLHVIRARVCTGRRLRQHVVIEPLPGERSEADARHYFQRMVARLDAGGAEATAILVVDDRWVGGAAVGYTERTAAELVGLTTRGRGPPSRLLHPSVNEEVGARCVPVLLTRHRQADHRVNRPDRGPGGHLHTAAAEEVDLRPEHA